MHSRRSACTKFLFLISAFLFVILCLRGIWNTKPHKHSAFQPVFDTKNSHYAVLGYNGVKPGGEVHQNNGVKPGGEVHQNNGVKPESEVQENNGVKPESEVQQNNGVKTGSEVQQNNGVKPGSEMQQNNGVKPGSEVQQNNGVKRGSEVQQYNGSAIEVQKLNMCRRFHLITMYFTGSKVSDNLDSSKFKKISSFIMHQHNFTDTQLGNRHREYMEVLQSNLNHPCVEKVHLFYVKDGDLEAVLSANLTNSSKLHPVKRERAIHMADFFVYASKHLLKKPVIALNGDIALGEGFDKIDINKLLNLKLMYSLTRHEKNISCSVKLQMCPSEYRGSHDTHVFALAKPLNETLLMSILDYPINMYQAENGMIYTMRNTFHFKVTNPCMALKTYHHHCSTVHGPLNHSYSIYALGWKGSQVQGGVAPPAKL